MDLTFTLFYKEPEGTLGSLFTMLKLGLYANKSSNEVELKKYLMNMAWRSHDSSLSLFIPSYNNFNDEHPLSSGYLPVLLLEHGIEPRTSAEINYRIGVIYAYPQFLSEVYKPVHKSTWSLDYGQLHLAHLLPLDDDD